MKKKLLLVFSLLFVLPFAVKAVVYPNVTELDTHAEDGGNIILFSGSTENSSHAVMCKLYDDEDEEIDKLSVEVVNDGTDGTFVGTFLAPNVGTYTVACANYEGGTIVTDEVVVSELTQVAVEFNTNGGSAIDPVYVIVGQTISRPENPVLDGKAFGGWYEDGTFTTPFDFSTRITAFTTIYAKWNDPEEVQNQTRVQVIYTDGGTYQVDFETNDSENQGPLHAPINHSASYFVDPGTEVTLTAFPSGGYHFVEWRATHEEEDPDDPGHMIWADDGMISDETEYVFTPEGEFVNIKVVFEEDIPEMVTVTFDTNGGPEIEPIDIESGQTIERPNPDPENGDKVFDGWYEDATFTTEFDFNTPITTDTIIYAKWSYVVTFNTNGGSEIEPIKVAEGHTIPRPEDPEKEDKIFENWYEDFELENEYDFNNLVNQDVTLHAKWVQEYSKNDGNNNEVIFIGNENQNLHLVVTDLGALTDEQLSLMNPDLDRETFNALVESLTEAAKEYGTLILFLDISVFDQNNNTVDIDTAVNVKLAFTDAMKGYKSYKLVYIDGDDQGNIFLGTAYNLTKQGNQLVGNLPHLSAYVLVGSNEEDTTENGTNNPTTYDEIGKYLNTFAISIIGLLALLIIIKRKKVSIK